MILKSKVWKILSGVLLAALMVGCSAPTPVIPTPEPTVDTRPTMEAVATQAVQTMVANLTQNAPTATPVTPTSTPAPTNTSAPVATETPAPTSTATRVFIPWTKTPTATAIIYGCSVTSVSPKSTDTITVDQDFDGKWTVKNTGSKTWSSGNTDIRFVDGTKFQQNGDIYDLASDVAPNGTYTITIDMKAPSGDGTYSASWGIFLEDGSVCSLGLTINVTK